MKYERFEVYVKMDCKFCKKAVDLLSLKGVPFTVTVCDKDPVYLDEMKANFGWPTVPIIVGQTSAQKEVIGGSTELETVLLNG